MAPTPVPTDNPFQSFADMVDYSILYKNLHEKGIDLTDEEKKCCEAICGDRLRNHDAGQVIGNSFGATIQSWVYEMFAIVQKLFGIHSDSVSDFASKAGDSLSASSEQTKLFNLSLAEAESYDRLKSAGGNLALAAEYITGMKHKNDTSPDQLIDNSILKQVGKHINLPLDNDISLNNHRLYANDATPTSGLPPQLSTQPLTASR